MTLQPSTDYADVWYRRQAPSDLPLHTPLQTRIEADVCIIGGGLAGLEMRDMGAKVTGLYAVPEYIPPVDAMVPVYQFPSKEEYERQAAIDEHSDPFDTNQTEIV